MRFAIVSIVIVALAVAAAQPVASGQLTNARTPILSDVAASHGVPLNPERVFWATHNGNTNGHS